MAHDLLDNTVFSVDDIVNICGVTTKLARVVHKKINGDYFDLSDAVEDTASVEKKIGEFDSETLDFENFGITLGAQLAWEEAVEREGIPEKVRQCQRQLKKWRRKERRERHQNAGKSRDDVILKDQQIEV